MLAILFAMPAARAVDYFWIGNPRSTTIGVSTNWSTSSSGTTPVASNPTFGTGDTWIITSTAVVAQMGNIHLGGGGGSLNLGNIRITTAASNSGIQFGNNSTASPTQPRSLTFGNNTSGTITVDADATANFRLGPIDSTFATGTLVLNGNLIVNHNGTGTLTLNGPITPDETSSRTLTKNGTGRLVIGGTATFTGATTIASGTLEVSGVGVLGNGSYAATISNTGALVFSTSQNQTLSGSLGGSGSLAKAGSGTLTLSNTTNGFTGGTTITAGVLSFANGALGPSGSVTVSGGTLAWAAGNTQDISSRLTLANASTATLDVGGNAVTFSNGFGAGTSGAVAKAGSGTLVLSAASTYSGATSVSAGTLIVNGGLPNTSGLTVAAGGMLGGTGSIGGATTITGTHSPGTSPGLQTFTGGLTYAATSVMIWELSANTASLGDRGVLFDAVNVTGGNLQIESGAIMNLVFNEPLASGSASTVNWSDPFWGANRSWIVHSFTSPDPATSTGLFTLGTVGTDSLGQSLTAIRTAASFSVERSGDDVLVIYTVPEPGGFVLLISGGLAAGSLAARRRRAAHRQAVQWPGRPHTP